MPREYLDISPFKDRTGMPGDELPRPQLEELDSRPPEDASGEAPPEEEGASPQGEDTGGSAPAAGMPEEAASVEDTGEQETEPKYDVTIKGAERLDNPDLPDEQTR